MVSRAVSAVNGGSKKTLRASALNHPLVGEMLSITQGLPTF